MTLCRILLADDDPQIRSFLQAVLRERDYIVAQASDGVEALDVLKAPGETVDLLITDIEMPRMDGIALARAVSEIFPNDSGVIHLRLVRSARGAGVARFAVCIPS